MKTGIRVLVLTLLTFSLIHPQNNSDKNKPSIPAERFYDSSHHWYDIKDEDKMITPRADQKRYSADDYKKIAENILLYQKSNGGWAKNYDMLAVLTKEQRDSVLKYKDATTTTFDNGSTHSHIEYLCQAYFRSKDKRFKDACVKGLKFILAAQYNNGGWPQFFPDTSGYRKYITFNDGAMTGVMKLLQKFVDRDPQHLFLEKDLYSQVKKSYQKGLACILKCQIKEEGKLLVWCQQHDNVTLLPQSARTFEPAAICNGESSEILLFLMGIKDPSKKIISSIQSAVKWLDESKILGLKVEEISAPKTVYKYHTTSSDRIVVTDPSAPPIWTRFTELKTHKPLFCNRDSKPVYSLAEVDRERRTGYTWYLYSPQEVINKYPEWQKRWSRDADVLKK